MKGFFPQMNTDEPGLRSMSGLAAFGFSARRSFSRPAPAGFEIRRNLLVALTILLVSLSACSSPTAETPTLQPLPSETATASFTPTATVTLPPGVTATPDLRLPPERWQEWPVVPDRISPRMLEVYEKGLALGRDPQRFSKIGDCQNVSTYFLGTYDKPGDYSLGTQYESLAPTIQHFSGSWSRTSVAVKGGMNVASVLSPIWADPKQCNKGEFPLACEIRLNNPSIVFISMETWWANKPPEQYEAYLRQIIQYTLDQGVVPILATKADNLEGDHAINQAIARVAYDYDIPLWNFWLAVQPLPNHGLSPDKFHLTYAHNIFDDPQRMENAWPWRNLTALQSIDFVFRSLNRDTGPVATITPTPTVPPTPTPATWDRRPVIPAGLSASMLELYKKGIAAGNNPRAFAKIGDGNAAADWFLTDFDRGMPSYNLGQYSGLQASIDYFAGSFGRHSLAAGAGFKPDSVFDTFFSDKTVCAAGENPLDCELRLHKPAFAFLLFGTNQAYKPDEFESGMRRLLDALVAHNVVPVLVTKADNREGDNRINEIISHLSDEYQAPLWNYWAAIQPLPGHGMQPDGEHITWAHNDFSDPQVMGYAWPWRNLTALQMLEALRTAVGQ
jgi:hypothetical protein